MSCANLPNSVFEFDSFEMNLGLSKFKLCEIRCNGFRTQEINAAVTKINRIIQNPTKTMFALSVPVTS